MEGKTRNNRLKLLFSATILHAIHAIFMQIRERMRDMRATFFARPMLKLLINKSAANFSDTFRKGIALLRSYGMRFTGILSYHGIKVRYILSIAKLESHT